MIGKFTELNNATGRSVHNLEALGLPATQKCVKILWMYPDSLSIHGGRGDLMALLKFATMAKLPVEICRVERLTDPVPLEDADMLYFCCGDLTCMPDVIKALEPRKTQLQAFAQAGKVIVANGSTGAILAKELKLLDGTVVSGLGLLGMVWTQRKTVQGDDLWLEALDGIEVIGNEIKLAGIKLDPDQAPFGHVRYGHGNCGGADEGAVTGNVIYTSCLGPVLVRNPALAMELLRRGAGAAGIETTPEQFRLRTEDIPHEQACLEEAKRFIGKKMEK